MKREPDIHEAAKRFVSRYIHRRKTRRLHTTRNKLSIDELHELKQEIGLKPKGIWYGLADSWIDWCLGESFGGIHQYIYEVVIDESQILKIDNISDFEKFEEEYCEVPGMGGFFPSMPLSFRRSRYFHAVNYTKIAEKFCGVEISPYQWEKRLESMWYYGWDCASGCIWNPLGVKEMRLFAHYDSELDEFIKTSLQPVKN